jgi:hypothetical protein
MKKCIGLLLATILMYSLLPTSAFAELAQNDYEFLSVSEGDATDVTVRNEAIDDDTTIGFESSEDIDETVTSVSTAQETEEVTETTTVQSFAALSADPLDDLTIDLASERLV